MVVLPYGFFSWTHDDRLRILGAPDFQTNRCVACIQFYRNNIYIYTHTNRSYHMYWADEQNGAFIFSKS